ncbi:hypothetical protein [Paraburkholderia unamae]|uniref:hypothetical protein n=1 Tax=Paraburkholderia unamae TaxID=219649 RepID=UPI00140396F2|nr:hypothetical protein [Paraburkholderia unamae]
MGETIACSVSVASIDINVKCGERHDALTFTCRRFPRPSDAARRSLTHKRAPCG